MAGHRIGPETDRLILRAMNTDDAEAFFALNSNPEVMRLTGEPPLRSIEEARAAIESYPDFETVGFGRWGCELKTSRSIIGFCGLKRLEELDLVDVGFRFTPEHWGRGLATEACAASITFGFEVLNLRKIVGLALPDNAASIRVLTKCGMRRNGTVSYDGHTALLFEVHR
ncbi:MAG TPA: GNAT family N-acetyltransferase [Phycisphaerales bacterium]|nr:GNAT family N-acetyltransferase [Phycisphaerales bacterium]